MSRQNELVNTFPNGTEVVVTSKENAFSLMEPRPLNSTDITSVVVHGETTTKLIVDEHFDHNYPNIWIDTLMTHLIQSMLGSFKEIITPFDADVTHLTESLSSLKVEVPKKDFSKFYRMAFQDGSFTFFDEESVYAIERCYSGDVWFTTVIQEKIFPPNGKVRGLDKNHYVVSELKRFSLASKTARPIAQKEAISLFN